MTNIENIILLADISSKFTVNILKALLLLDKNTYVYVVSKHTPKIILPDNCFYINFSQFENSTLLKQSLDTPSSLAVAIHATEYAIALDNFTKVKKIAFFTGDDTLFRRATDRTLTSRFNHIFESVDGVGFCSFFHQQEYVPFVNSPSFLIPYGYKGYKDHISPLNYPNKKQYNKINIAVIPPSNAITLFTKLAEFDEMFSIGSDLSTSYHICANKDEISALKQFLETSAFDFDCYFYDKNYQSDMVKLIRTSDMTISFKETYSIDDSINLLFEKHHPIFVYFVRDYIDLENSATHIMYYESIIGLAKKTKAILNNQTAFYSKTEDGYKRFIEERSFDTLQEKLRVRIEQIFNAPLHVNHEDTNFYVDDKEKVAVFVHFAAIETHRHSERPMRVRAMRDTMKNNVRTFVLLGNDRVISKKLQYVEYLSETNKVSFVYEESLSSPHSMHSQPALKHLRFRDIVKRYNLQYFIFLRDIYQAYPVYEKLMPEHFTSRFQALRDDTISIAKVAKRIFTPSKSFMKEVVLKGVLPTSYKDKLSTLPPAINATLSIFNNAHTSGSNENIKIVYAGGMGEFYDFSVFLEAVLLCSNLPIEFHLYIKKEELEKSRHIYGYALDTAPHVFIHSGSFTELAIGEDFDLALCLFDDDSYRKMAIPVKVFDYASLEIPIIVGEGTEAGELVNEFDTGFVLKNKVSEIVQLLISLSQNRELLSIKQKNISKFIEQNSWQSRIHKIIEESR